MEPENQKSSLLIKVGRSHAAIIVERFVNSSKGCWVHSNVTCSDPSSNRVPVTGAAAPFLFRAAFQEAEPGDQGAGFEPCPTVHGGFF